MTPFEQRIGYCVTCAIPAHVLDATMEDGTSLRMDASTDGLTFVRVLRQLDACYQARVAASSEELSVNGYTVLLSESDLSFALPYDVRIQRQDPERVLELLHAHAATVRPAPRVPVATFEQDTAIGIFELPMAEVREQYSQMSGDRSMQRVLLHLAHAAVEQIIARGQEAAEPLQVRAARLEALQGQRCVVRSTIVRRPGGEVWQVQFAKEVAA